MGLLDDAIRDHLELKRRHGADPSEVARQEDEALGPARREPVDPAPAPVSAGHRELYDDVAAFEDEPAGSPDAYEPTAADERIEAGVEDEEPIFDEDLLEEEPERPEPSIPAGEPEAPVAPAVPRDDADDDDEEDHRRDTPSRGEDQPTQQFSPEDEDVLEETPEFLQETPEHDRLWFEQKPPRDFDF
jgi:hypothetical protein